MSNEYPYLRIDYDEEDNEAAVNKSYRGVIMEVAGETTRFFSGDPTVDWITSGIVAYHLYGNNALCSSSVDHFGLDGGNIQYDDWDEATIEKGREYARTFILPPND